MPTKKKKGTRLTYFIALDVLTVLVAAFVPMVFRFGIFDIDMQYVYMELKWIAVDIAILLIVNTIFKLYDRVWSFASIGEMRDCILSASVTEAVYIAYKMLLHIAMPRSYYPVNWMALVMLLCASRVSVRVFRRMQYRGKQSGNKVNVMIVGAGSAGSMLINELKYGPGNYNPVCVIDDNPSKTSGLIQGVPIVGTREDIEDAVFKYGVKEIIIAIPSATPTELRELVEVCNKTKARVKRLPVIAATLTGSLSASIRDVNYEDLLARDAVIINNDELANTIQGKTVMVTGGGGSIGSEICRQLVANKVEKLVIVDEYENTTYELEQELRRFYPESDIEIQIASIRDYERMEEIMKEYQPAFIYHAAAHKHVPLMEYSPNEAVKNNCEGTLNMVKLADKYGVEKFVQISTDKAVRPTNVMGATKRICEMIIQDYNNKSQTEFVAVRFGNVLGSNGSVIPHFLKQIESGGPVTVTHRDITRFFMTIPEAVSLVLAAGLMAKGGEIFVLDMGEPVRIYDLACNLIRMKGLEPEEDIKIDIIGLRPGEKLYEEILMEEEGLQETENQKIHIGKPLEIDSDFETKLNNLIKEAENNTDKIRELLQQIVDGYQPKVKYE